MDLAIVETLNGGDLQLTKNDIAVVDDLENMPYLGMFGGNLEAVTKTRPAGSQAFDYWGNNLLMLSNDSIQFNSITEKTLNNTPLTSEGRVIIENAIKEDLKFLNPLATVEVSVTIVSTDRIDIIIKVIQNEGGIRIIKFKLRRIPDGDFFIQDYNNDFF